MKKKIIKNPLPSNFNKPNTITRAGITANLKFTRGKQLVEHNPFSLIPDPKNPRPGELIDDFWLISNLKIGTSNSLCKEDKELGGYIIPEFSVLSCESNEDLEESYNFLRDLAYSIRSEGLIEPIEIFLADKNNDPLYFLNSSLEYGYVILEGHQRRLAAMMAGVSTVTCIEITDESLLARLNVKHRKLRRQLSENNLRKGLTVAQNFQIVQELLSETSSQNLTNKELSSIIGLNESIASALRTICIKSDNYPPILFSQIKENKLTFKKIRLLAPKSYKEIESYFKEDKPLLSVTNVIKARGRMGGAIKKSATFKIKDEKESSVLEELLLTRFPEIKNFKKEQSSFKNLENILNKIREMALNILV